MRDGDGRQAANKRTQAAPSARRASIGKWRASCRRGPAGRITAVGDALEASDQIGGIEDLKRVGVCGRPPRLSDAQLLELAQLLKKDSISAGYLTELWTLSRIAALIQRRGSRYDWPSVRFWSLLGRMGWSVQRPTGQASTSARRAPFPPGRKGVGRD
jgi:Winged helix-turn helix